jgi:hypothetical protein
MAHAIAHEAGAHGLRRVPCTSLLERERGSEYDHHERIMGNAVPVVRPQCSFFVLVGSRFLGDEPSTYAILRLQFLHIYVELYLGCDNLK